MLEHESVESLCGVVEGPAARVLLVEVVGEQRVDATGGPVEELREGELGVSEESAEVGVVCAPRGGPEGRVT